MKTLLDTAVTRALLREVDLTFRRSYHQTLDDVIRDLRIRRVLGSPDPSATTILTALRQTGILEMNSGSTLAGLRRTLDRYAAGLLGICEDCHRPIAQKEIVHRPSLRLCARCRKKREHDP